MRCLMSVISIFITLYFHHYCVSHRLDRGVFVAGQSQTVREREREGREKREKREREEKRKMERVITLRGCEGNTVNERSYL